MSKEEKKGRLQGILDEIMGNKKPARAVKDKRKEHQEAFPDTASALREFQDLTGIFLDKEDRKWFTTHVEQNGLSRRFVEDLIVEMEMVRAGEAQSIKGNNNVQISGNHNSVKKD